jgi:REP element-mobilizing transposase RayT
MARALRIERPGGRYHVTSRGNERKALFRDDSDRFHFFELLAELGQRFGARVHAYVLMGNHFHLLPFSSAAGNAGSQPEPHHAVAGGQLQPMV